MKKPIFSKSDFRVLKLAWELGYTIAIPIVLSALLGRFLDKKFDTSPWFLLLGIFLSIFISSFGVYKKTVAILKDLEKSQENKKTKKQENQKIINK
ncbi:MAG: AtpZ/AtpI family protein [Patescibacteria group bacterium]